MINLQWTISINIFKKHIILAQIVPLFIVPGRLLTNTEEPRRR